LTAAPISTANAKTSGILDDATGSLLLLDQHHHLQTAWPQSVKQDPEQAVDREQSEPTRPPPEKNVELVPQSQVF
jgi:hypothetical protein